MLATIFQLQVKQQFFKSTFRKAAKLKVEMIEKLHIKQWSLHFDGKDIEESEYQVVVLRNERTKVKLDALHLKDGKAKTIAVGFAKVLNKYNLRKSKKMIIAVQTAYLTGSIKYNELKAAFMNGTEQILDK